MLLPSKVAPNRSRRWVEVVRVVAPLVVLGVGIGGLLILINNSKSPPRVDIVLQPPMVDVAVVEAHTGSLDLDVDGVVVPWREVTLSAEVAGRVASKSPNCRAGRYVAQGTVLLEIDRRDYQIEYDRLASELGQAKSSINELKVEISNTRQLIELAESELQLQRKEVGRLERLVTNRVISEGELDNARRQELAALNTLATWRNQLNLLEAREARLEHAAQLVSVQLGKAELDLQRTTVRAPIDGLIARDLVETDDFVQRGTQLVVVEDNSTVEVKCNLRMDELYWLWDQAESRGNLLAHRLPTEGFEIPPAPATVTYTLAGRTFAWEGTLSRFDGTGLDERTRMVACRVKVPNPLRPTVDSLDTEPPQGGLPVLLRGMFVSVRIHAQPRTPLLRLPEQAIRPGKIIWRVTDGALDMVPVAVARISQNTAIVPAVANGLRAGDQIVTSPVSGAVEGMPVRVGAAP